MSKINVNIKQIRESQRLTQSEFSDILGVSRSTITKIEGGEVKLSKKMLLKLEACFPFEFNKSENNVKYKSIKPDEMSDLQKFYWDNLISLNSIKNKLKIICLAIKKIDNNYFDSTKIDELNNINKAIIVLSNVVFHHGGISDELSFKSYSAVSRSEKLFDFYLNELYSKLELKINDFDNLLLNDLYGIEEDLPF